MIILRLLHCRKISVSSVQALCLTTAGMPMNQVLEVFIPDVITGTTKGFDWVDVKDRKIKSFP